MSLKSNPFVKLSDCTSEQSNSLESRWSHMLADMQKSNVKESNGDAGHNPNFNQICRTCLAKEEPLSLILDLVFEDCTLISLMEKYIFVKVHKDDCLPQNICNNCLSEVIRIHGFIKKCHDSETQLRARLDCNNDGHIDERSVHDDSFDESNLKEEKESQAGCNNTVKNKKIEEAGPPYICTTCNENYKELEQLNAHRKQMKHFRWKQYKCRKCSSNKLFSLYQLQNHMRTHTREKPYDCNICGRGFSLNSNLRRHMKIHTGERPHVCDYCGKGFIQSSSLIEHRRIHTHETPFKCHLCTTKFSQSSRYRQHLRLHQIKDGSNSELLADQQCKQCLKICSSKSALKAHTLLHNEKMYLCNECGKNFYSQGGLTLHMKIHKGIKSYKCDICEKLFTQSGTLKAHIRIHTGQRPFGCKDCNKTFTQLPHLNYHMRTHSGEKPYSCSYCGKSFSMKSTLTVHIRIHTGELPFDCDVCGKGFNNSSAMKKHKSIHKMRQVAAGEPI